MTADHFGWLAGGLVLLALAAVCWSGGWRGWVGWDSPEYSRSFPLTLPPGLGALAVAYGISPLLPKAANLAVFAAGMLAALAGSALLLWEPEWYGPRWYREVNKAFDKAAPANLACMAEDARRPGESSLEATYRHQTSGRRMPPAEWMRLVADPGEWLGGVPRGRSVVVFYPQAPVVGGHDENKTYPHKTIAAESLRAVRKLEPGTGLDGVVRRSGWRSRLVGRVRIDTGEGSWLLETRKAGRVAREIERRYLDPATNLYGMAPPRGASSGFGYARGSDGTNEEEGRRGFP